MQVGESDTVYLYNITKKGWLSTAHEIWDWTHNRTNSQPTLDTHAIHATILRVHFSSYKSRGAGVVTAFETLQPLKDHRSFLTNHRLWNGNYPGSVIYRHGAGKRGASSWIVTDVADPSSKQVSYGQPVTIRNLKADMHLDGPDKHQRQTDPKAIDFVGLSRLPAQWMMIPTKQLYSCEPEVPRCYSSIGDDNILLNLECGSGGCRSQKFGRDVYDNKEVCERCCGKK